MRAYSYDLRERIVAAVEGGMNKCEAARVFRVSLNSVKRYVSLKHSTGQLAPKPRPGQKANISGDKVEMLRQQIKQNPDATLQQHSEQWAQTQGTKLSCSTFSRALKRHKITYKKSLKASERDEAQRTQFRANQSDLVVARLRILDETSVNLAMTRR